MSERPKWQPPEKESEDPKIYVKREEKISCDKGNHAERSKVNQPNHLIFWKKEKAKEKEKEE